MAVTTIQEWAESTLSKDQDSDHAELKAAFKDVDTRTLNAIAIDSIMLLCERDLDRGIATLEIVQNVLNQRKVEVILSQLRDRLNKVYEKEKAGNEV
jgi:hypothetical protein